MSKQSRRQESQPEKAMPLEAPASGLEKRVTQIEGVLQALVMSHFGAVTSNGQTVPRCRCKLFATRIAEVCHPVAGISHEVCCDRCSPESRISRDEKSTVTYEPLSIGEADLSRVRQLNASVMPLVHPTEES